MTQKSVKNDLGDEGLETQFRPFPNYSRELILQENALRVIVDFEGEPGSGQAATSGPKPTHRPNDRSHH